jgi:hypothetical protein
MFRRAEFALRDELLAPHAATGNTLRALLLKTIIFPLETALSVGCVDMVSPLPTVAAIVLKSNKESWPDTAKRGLIIVSIHVWLSVSE